MPTRTQKTSISLPASVIASAKERAAECGFENSFSAYVAKLIKDDLARNPRQDTGKPLRRPHSPN